MRQSPFSDSHIQAILNRHAALLPGRRLVMANPAGALS